MLKRCLLVSASLLVLCSGAHADTCLPRPGPPAWGIWKYNTTRKCWYPSSDKEQIHALRTEEVHIFKHFWTGPYAGINVGYGAAALTAGLPSFAAPGFPTTVNTGILSGAQVGYQIRVKKMMFAIEDQFDLTNIRAVSEELNNESQVKWTNTTNLLVGYTVLPRILTYFGIGVAEAEKTTTDFTSASIWNKQLIGWDAELGARLALTDNVSTGVKYQVMDFGRNDWIQAVKWEFNFTHIEINGQPSPLLW